MLFRVLSNVRSAYCCRRLVTVIGLVIDFLNTVVLSSVPSSCLVFCCSVGCAVILSSFLLFRRLRPFANCCSVGCSVVPSTFRVPRFLTAVWVCRCLTDKNFERQVHMQGRTLLQQMSDKSLPHPFTEEISSALQKTKPETAPGYDNIHVEFL